MKRSRDSPIQGCCIKSTQLAKNRRIRPRQILEMESVKLLLSVILNARRGLREDGHYVGGRSLRLRCMIKRVIGPIATMIVGYAATEMAIERSCSFSEQQPCPRNMMTREGCLTLPTP